MMLKARFMAGVAGCALAANSVAFAAAVTQTFESSTESWTGDGATGAEAYTAPSGGLPISTSVASENKVLVVEGSAAYDASSVNGSNSGLVDMMIKASIPDDALAAPEEANVQVAVAVDSDRALKVYCTKPDGTAGWCPLGKTVTADEWVRVSLKFDYTNNRCQVRINGEPKMTEYGYQTANGTKTPSSTTTGSWYKLAKNPNSSAKIAGLSVSGCTAIDEVVLDKDGSHTYLINGTDGANAIIAAGGSVPLKWYDDNGIAWDATKKYGNYTAAESYERCLSPFSTETFALKEMSTTSTQVTFTIPETIATTGRKVVLDVGSDKTFNTKTSTDVTAGATTVSVDLPKTQGEVKYYRLRATSSN